MCDHDTLIRNKKNIMKEYIVTMKRPDGISVFETIEEAYNELIALIQHLDKCKTSGAVIKNMKEVTFNIIEL